MFERMVLVGMLVIGAGVANAYEPCGPLKTGYGPYDYRTQKKKLELVEQFHFTSDVETLRHGNTGPLGGDLDYTLRASPNHSRALMAMVNLGFMMHTNRPKGTRYTIPCYFDRAIRFAPDDDEVYLIYGIYLARSGKKQDALTALHKAESLQKDDANIQYNLGLVYFSLKDYPNALLHAQRAYGLGFALPGLKKELQDVGQWQDPPSGPPKEEKAAEVAVPPSPPK